MKLTPLYGMPGEPLPYMLYSDWMVTCVLFLCIILVSLVLSNKKKYLQQKARSFFFNRERVSFFDEMTAIDVRQIVLLLFHTCVMIAFCLYHYFAHTNSALLEQIPHFVLLSIFIGGTLVFLGTKCMVYSFVNWVFFQKDRNLLWIDAFVNLFIVLGLLLLPVVLLIVYFNLSSQIALFLGGTMVIFAKIALLWKCFSNFFGKIHRILHLILYFCALEILPDLVLWKGIEMLNNNLILKF